MNDSWSTHAPHEKKPSSFPDGVMVQGEVRRSALVSALAVPIPFCAYS